MVTLYYFVDRHKSKNHLVQHNKHHQRKVLLSSFHLNGHTFIPCGTQMLWYGADDSPTRTGSDAQTQWASVQFSWQDKTYLPPFHAGVRIAFNGYKDKTTGEWSVDTQRWNNILDLSKKGTEVTAAVMDISSVWASAYYDYHSQNILTKSNMKRRITISPKTSTTANTPKSVTEKCEGNILVVSKMAIWRWSWDRECI